MNLNENEANATINGRTTKTGHEEITVTCLGVLHFPMRIRFDLFLNASSLYFKAVYFLQLLTFKQFIFKQHMFR